MKQAMLSLLREIVRDMEIVNGKAICFPVGQRIDLADALDDAAKLRCMIERLSEVGSEALRGGTRGL